VDALGLTFALLAVRAVDRHQRLLQRLRAGGQPEAPAALLRAFAASVGAADGRRVRRQPADVLPVLRALTLATYPLVVHKESAKAFAAGRRYLLFALGGGLALLTAIAWTWQLTGSLDFVPGGFLRARLAGVLAVLFALFVTGVA
jgi:multicomponent Na+:H+ antiporter subunit D